MLDYLSSFFRSMFSKEGVVVKKPIKPSHTLEDIVSQTSLSVREIFQRSLKDKTISSALLSKSKRRIEDMDRIFKRKLVIDEGMKESITGIAGYENFIRREYERIYPYGKLNYNPELDWNKVPVEYRNKKIPRDILNKAIDSKQYHIHKSDMKSIINSDNIKCVRCIEKKIDNIYNDKYINLVKELIRRLDNIIVKREFNANIDSLDWIISTKNRQRQHKVKEINILNEVKDVILKNVDRNKIEKEIKELEFRLKRADDKLLEQYDKGFKDLYNKEIELSIKSTEESKKVKNIKEPISMTGEYSVNKVEEIKSHSPTEKKDIKIPFPGINTFKEQFNIFPTVKTTEEIKPKPIEPIIPQEKSKININPLFESVSEENKTSFFSSTEETNPLASSTTHNKLLFPQPKKDEKNPLLPEELIKEEKIPMKEEIGSLFPKEQRINPLLPEQLIREEPKSLFPSTIQNKPLISEQPKEEALINEKEIKPLFPPNIQNNYEYENTVERQKRKLNEDFNKQPMFKQNEISQFNKLPEYNPFISTQEQITQDKRTNEIPQFNFGSWNSSNTFNTNTINDANTNTFNNYNTPLDINNNNINSFTNKTEQSTNPFESLLNFSTDDANKSNNSLLFDEEQQKKKDNVFE